jgi:hypothetical protein
MLHELKIWPVAFAAVWSGHKTAEFRKHDRDFNVGDVLCLREYDEESDLYTGREVIATLTHMQKGFGIPEEFIMLSFQILWGRDHK